MIRVAVDAQIVGEVISAWTGIPVGKMMKDEISTVLSLPSFLGQRVIGQIARAGNYQPANFHLARAARRSQQADRRFHAGGPERRRQDGNRARAV